MTAENIQHGEKILDIDLLKNLLIENGISVESDVSQPMGVFDNGDPFFVRTLLITDYVSPEQFILKTLLDEGATKFRYHATITLDRTSRKIGNINGRDHKYMDFPDFADNGERVIVPSDTYVYDIIKFATDKDICAKMIE